MIGEFFLTREMQFSCMRKKFVILKKHFVFSLFCFGRMPQRCTIYAKKYQFAVSNTLLTLSDLHNLLFYAFFPRLCDKATRNAKFAAETSKNMIAYSQN